jgi:vanillate O-demethylase ferredoxin subunit
VQTLELLVKSVTWESPAIRAYDLRQPSGAPLPPFRAGAHVDLALPNGLTRSYSLLNSEAERMRYVIAVQNEPAGRGGSRWVHQNLQAGERVAVGAPRNNFPLAEDAPDSLLIAGGIGITPMLSMVTRLVSLGRAWTLHYCARTRADAAFLDKLDALGGMPRGQVHLNFDHEPGGRMLDLAALVAAAPAGAHLYCCGPAPMLAAFEAAAVGRDPRQVHVEHFSATEAPATTGGFTVVLAKSGREVFVAAGETILDAVLAAGIEAPHSCMEGVCGSCEASVLDGLPDHRDLVLSSAEKAANRTMMICCSGSKGARLTLDL